MAVGHFDYINSRRIPYPNREYVESFDNLTGGINTLDQAFLLKSSESPMMKNLTYREGMLGSRRGQIRMTGSNVNDYVLPTKTTNNKPITYLAAAPFLFHGWWLLQADTEYDGVDSRPLRFYVVKMEENGVVDEKRVGYTHQAGTFLASPPRVTTPGIFFEYRDHVYFKAKGVYVRFSWDSVNDDIYHNNSADIAYVPIIQIDSDPATGAGLQYQQENRLTPRKEVQFKVTAAGTLSYQLPYTNISTVPAVAAYTGDYDGTHTIYDIDTGNTNYTTGVIVLQTAPPADSILKIRFATVNPGALDSIMDSTAAIVFGGVQELCVVIGGPPAQPNAYFWSGNNGLVMDPTYFPINQYNLAGDNDDPITCFGKQQNMLVIFQPHAVGRAVFGTETLDGYVQVTMDYTRINHQIGCDFPGSLQLVENNLVWVSRKYGVCRLKDCSAAYENNITIISRKIHNGWYTKDENSVAEYTGLFSHLRNISASNVYSVDTGTRYLFCVRGVTARWFYEWNYEISSYENPSWYIHTNIEGVGFLSLENDQLMEVTPDGVIAEFTDGAYYDQMKYNAGKTELVKEPIRKVYFFPPRNFGSYDRLKNIMSCVFTTRHDTDQSTRVYYNCDYEDREDPTRLTVTGGGEHWGRPFASVFRRKPGYHNIRHLQIRLFNNDVGKDLSIISLQIFYTFRGRQR